MDAADAAGTSRAAEAFAALTAEDRSSGGLPLAQREALLGALAHHLVEQRERLVEALDGDFGRRSREETLVAEMLSVVNAARYAQHRLRRWAKPRRVGVPLPFWPTRAWLVPQPLGVVGIISPWNYPVQLSLVPLIDAIAAGNRVVLKPSEAVPRTAAALSALLEGALGPAIARVVLGGPEVAADLARLPLGHLLFTGSGAAGRELMRLAAEHLTPLTLELGGKCPAILMPDADVDHAARVLVLRKGLNAGQTCVAPDMLLVVGQPLDPVRDALARACRRHFPDGLQTAVLPGKQEARLARMTKGAQLEPLMPDRAGLALVRELPGGVALANEEVFGPILPLRACRDLAQALDQVGRLPAPLAVYLFTRDRAVERRVLAATRAGALVVNDAVIQAAMETLPFGGVGASGFGRYRGRAGFDTFSNLRVHLRAARWSLSALVDPPYGARTRGLIERLVRQG